MGIFCIYDHLEETGTGKAPSFFQGLTVPNEPFLLSAETYVALVRIYHVQHNHKQKGTTNFLVRAVVDTLVEDNNIPEKDSCMLEVECDILVQTEREDRLHAMLCRLANFHAGACYA